MLKESWPYDVTVAPLGEPRCSFELIFRIVSRHTPDELIEKDGTRVRQAIFDQCHVDLPLTYLINSIEPTHPEFPDLENPDEPIE